MQISLGLKSVPFSLGSVVARDNSAHRRATMRWFRWCDLEHYADVCFAAKRGTPRALYSGTNNQLRDAHLRPRGPDSARSRDVTAIVHARLRQALAAFLEVADLDERRP